MFQKLQQLQILPSDLCTDEEFVRRVYLDVIGVLPEPSETAAVSGRSAIRNKRAKLIDALLERPEFAEFWALKWGDLLRIRNAKVSAGGVHKFNRWLVAALRDNMPYDQFARAAADRRGQHVRQSAGQLLPHGHRDQRLHRDHLAVVPGHSHSVRQVPQPSVRALDAGQLLRHRRVLQSRAAQAGRQSRGASDLGGPRGRSHAAAHRQADEALAAADGRRPTCRARTIAARRSSTGWCKPDNPFFAKVEVNRIWGHLMGRGIVEPVDDFRDSNPPSSAALLDALAEDFVKNGYDRKRVMRTILNSRTYQLSSRKNEFNANDAKYFSHATTRLLAAEQLLDAICRVTERVGEVRRSAGRHAGHAAAQPRRRQRLPQGLRPAGPRDGLPVRAVDRLEPVAGACR